MDTLVSHIIAWFKDDPGPHTGLALLFLGIFILYVSALVFVIATSPWWGGILFFGGSLVVAGWITMLVAL